MQVPNIPVGLDAALSFAMAMLIAFRVNRAYERWWEARTLWGTLVNVSRNLAVKISRLRCPASEDCQRARDLIVAFCIGLKDHLRSEAHLSGLPGFHNDANRVAHVPSYIAGHIYQLFQKWRTQEESMSDMELLVLDSESRVLLDVCGACERIKNTPVSISWRVFTTQCIILYLLVLPWGLVDDFGFFTVPLTIAVAYIVIAAEMIARYVEAPFGFHEDHLDLESITETIDVSVSDELLRGIE